MAFVNSVRTYSEKKLIGYTREQLFDVVAAVENYHLFVPACRKSQVVHRSRSRIQAKLEIGIPPLLEAYTSNVKLEKPRLISASCTEGHLFKHLETRWRFRPPPEQYSAAESNTNNNNTTTTKHTTVGTMETIVPTTNNNNNSADNNNSNGSSSSSSSSSINNSHNIDSGDISCGAGTGTSINSNSNNNSNNKNSKSNNTTTATTTTDTTTTTNSKNSSTTNTDNSDTTTNNGDINSSSKISNDKEKQQTNSSFDPANNSTTTTTNNNNNINSDGGTNQHHQSTNLKLKRCKHGRIIVKDPSKKKPVQLPPPPLGNSRVVIELPKAVQLEASPKKSLSARLSMTPSSNNSESSDIYDPEEPIEPISPVDSPPLSPINNKAANHHRITYRLDGDKNDDDVPSSAVQLNHQEKYLQKLNRQERVVEEVKVALKPHYQRRAITKEQYKDVLRRAVPKVCHSKNGEINPVKIRALVEAYVKKMKRHQ